jgi:hypothetical protein
LKGLALVLVSERVGKGKGRPGAALDQTIAQVTSSRTSHLSALYPTQPFSHEHAIETIFLDAGKLLVSEFCVDVLCGCFVWMFCVDVLCGCFVWMFCVDVLCGLTSFVHGSIRIEADLGEPNFKASASAKAIMRRPRPDPGRSGLRPRYRGAENQLLAKAPPSL